MSIKNKQFLKTFLNHKLGLFLILVNLLFSNFLFAQNVPPEFISNPDTSITNDQIYNYQITVNDRDGDFYKISATLLPKWLNFYSTKVSTFAGSNAGYLDGTVALSKFWGPSAIAIDRFGNLFIAEFNNHRIRKITTDGMVTTIAGSGEAGYLDSTGVNAQFNHPSGIAVDDIGNIYVAEETNHTIRKIFPDGTVTTLAGNGSAGFKDSTGIYSEFNTPQGIDLDSTGNVYVADYNNNRIRKISVDGIVTTYAGTGISGFEDGVADSAKFRGPSDVTVDGFRSVFVSDARNHRIRKISPEGNVITIAGNSEGGFLDGSPNTALFWYPFGISIDKWGNLYVADGLNESIRRISPEGYTTTLAGWQSPGYKNGTGKESKFNGVGNIAVDSAGNVYVPELINQKIRKIESFPIVTGDPKNYAGVHSVQLKVMDSNTDFSIQDFTIRVLDVIPPVASCLSDTVLFLDESGSAMLNADAVNLGSFDDNGIAFLSIDSSSFSLINLNSPLDITLKVTDNYSNFSTCTTTVVFQEAKTESAPVFVSFPDTAVIDTQIYSYTISVYDKNGNKLSVSAPELPEWLFLSNDYPVNNYAGSDVSGYENGDVSQALFNGPNGLLFDRNGNLYVADVNNHCIRVIDSEGVVQKFAGSGDQGYLDGSANNAEFNAPVDLAMDNWGNIFVADFYNHVIRKILPDGTVTTLAGTGEPGFKNGPGSEAKFNHPNGITLDSTGNVFVADFLNQRIRKIEPDGTTSTFAGSGISGYLNGTVENSRFLYPSDVEFDKEGNLMVVDNGNNCIRKIIQGAVVRTFSGTKEADFTDGSNDSARFDSPIRIVSDSLGNFYVSDYYNYAIRKITGDGTVSTLAGNGLPGMKDTIGIYSQFKNSIGIAINNQGEVYATDDHRIRKIETLPKLEGLPEGKLGTHSILLKVTDSEGLVSFQDFKIHVKEVVPPVAICRDTSVFLDSAGVVSINAELVGFESYDSSGIYSLGIDNQSFSCEDLEDDVEVVLTVTDNYFNISTCTAQISILDTLKPMINRVEDIYVEISLDKKGAFIDYPEINVSDNCEFSVSLVDGLGAEAFFPAGENLEIWQATDKSGNSMEMHFNVIIGYDNIPYFDSLPNVTVKEDTSYIRIPVENISVGEQNYVEKIEFTVKNKDTSTLISSYLVEYNHGDTSAFINLLVFPDVFGTENWSVIISDNEGRQTSRDFSLMVEAVNDSPVLIRPINDLMIFAGEENQFLISSILGDIFNDIDDTYLELTYNLLNDDPLPEWLQRSGDLFIAEPVMSDTGCINLVVTATDLEGLNVSDTFEVCIVDRAVGIYDLIIDKPEIEIFPNPVRRLVNVKILNTDCKNLHLSLFNYSGQKILERTFTNNELLQIDMMNYVSGIYLIRIEFNDKSIMKKFIFTKK